ncbi:hypothetical protein [Flavobacterium soyangense]|uniref:Uncharacterized protein n=1 Tax=Flavobacterium soyangense TaxID=2023265 RepID=A0A930UA40_9FLAO|nr:hypothetical protein [Flavobacterium soyangense]MBF2709738.1 hypothetical protein [Flavobacterium soyangense]
MTLYDFPKEKKTTRTKLLYAHLGLPYGFTLPIPTIYEGKNRPKAKYKRYFTEYFGYEIKGDINEMVFNSFDVLWCLLKNPNQFQYYKNTIDALAESFAPILGFSKEASEKAVEQMVLALGFSNLSIKEIVFVANGYYDMQKFSKPFNGLMQLFLFWLTSLQMEEYDLDTLKSFQLFQTLFGKEINLDLYSSSTDIEMMNAFLSCFSIGSNDIAYFNLQLALK